MLTQILICKVISLKKTQFQIHVILFVKGLLLCYFFVVFHRPGAVLQTSACLKSTRLRAFPFSGLNQSQNAFCAVIAVQNRQLRGVLGRFWCCFGVFGLPVGCFL